MYALIGAFLLGLADDREDLGKAVKKTSEAESYTFKIGIDLEGSPLPVGAIEFDGKHNKETATHISGSVAGNDFEAYRKGEKVASKNASGAWKLGKGGGAAGTATRNLKPPHEELKDFEKKLVEVKKSEKKEAVSGKECSIYEGEVTEEGAKGLLPIGRLGGAGKSSAKAKVWVDAEGVLRKYEFNISLVFDFQGNTVEMTALRVTTLSEIGTTKVEVPEEVKALLEEKK